MCWPQALAIRLILFCGAFGAWTDCRATDPGAFDPGLDPDLGFNMVSWWNFGSSGASVWEDSVQEMYDAGFREVSLSPVRFVTAGSGTIPTSSGQGPELSHLEAGIVRAKSLGMRVTVNPFVEMQNFAFWRGQYNPTPGSGEWNNFWSDYQQYIVDVATLAETHDVDAMTIGTELKALSRNVGNNSQWSSLISAVDGVYNGSLGYAANWDNYNHANVTNTIWENSAIDFMGIDAYFRIVSNGQADASGTYPDATFLNQVETGWVNEIENQILPFVDARKGGDGMELVFTEYGASPFNRGIVQQPQTNNVDQDEQLMAFEGLLRALDGRADQIQAMHIWQWGMPGSADSFFYMDPDLSGNTGGGFFDESLNTPTAAWLADFVSNPATAEGDFNGDGQLDGADIDLLIENIALGPADPDTYDLTSDGLVNTLDRNAWLIAAGAANLPSGGPYLLADANLDGNVDGLDFIDWNSNKFTALAAWTGGDWNADGIVDGLDFVIWNETKFTSADGLAIVPEPTAPVACLMAIVFIGRGFRRR